MGPQVIASDWLNNLIYLLKIWKSKPKEKRKKENFFILIYLKFCYMIEFGVNR
jgi:hypothetical protein